MNTCQLSSIALLLLLLTGCPGPEVKPAPQIITVTQDRYVPIPADLAADCPAPPLTARTWGGLADYVVSLRSALAECSGRMQAIRGVQGTPAK